VSSKVINQPLNSMNSAGRDKQVRLKSD